MKRLEDLSLTRLTVLEFGQHMKSLCENIEQLDQAIMTDEVMTDYISCLRSKSEEFHKAIIKIANCDDTARIMEADKARDTAISAAIRYLSVFEFSEDSEEHEAHAEIQALYEIYKKIPIQSFEEETTVINNLIYDLNSPKYTAQVSALNMNPHVIRITEANENFKMVCMNGTQEIPTENIFSVKSMRKELTMIYKDMTNYTLSMAKAMELEQHERILQIINTIRNYYADLLARRIPANTESVHIETQ